MIAHDDLYGASIPAVEAALTEEPLAGVATQTIASFTATADMLKHVGDLAIDYGVGKPLPIFQSLLVTYAALVRAQAALAKTAQHILSSAEQMAAKG